MHRTFTGKDFSAQQIILRKLLYLLKMHLKLFRGNDLGKFGKVF